MKTIKCENCGKESFGSNRRKFCCSSCRVNHWQKSNRKMKRFVIPKVEEMTVEQAQNRVLAGLMILKKAALNEDKIARKVLDEVDRVLGNIESEMKS